MPTIPIDIPVVIIGAGPTGLTTGLLLARYGVRSVILERNDAPLDIPRAIVLDDEGARTLQVFGADKTYVSQTIIGDGAEYIDDQGAQLGRVGAGAETYGYPKRHFVNQPEMETALRAKIEETPLCEVYFSCDVVAINEHPGFAVVSYTDPAGKTCNLQAQYIVAADGGRSPTRERLGIEMMGSTYEQDWIVVDTLNDPDDANYSRFYCSNKRPHVSIPAPNGGRRYEFMLLPGETHAEVLEDAFVADLLAPFRTISTADTVRKTIYTFHARMTERWREGRIVLAGDAAHLTPPFAGQGMNAGLRDAANVSWKLACVLKGGAADHILESYGEERRDPAWAMIQLAVIMGDLVMPIDKDQLAFRQQLLTTLAPFPAVQDYLLQMRFKPRPRFNTGLFLDLDKRDFESDLVGEMIPQPDIELAGVVQKLDAALGVGFALIAQDQAGAEALSKLETDGLMGLSLGKVYLPYRDASSAMPAAKTHDPRVKLLRTHRDQILLIRPDRYCAAAFAPEDLADGISQYIKRLT